MDLNSIRILTIGLFMILTVASVAAGNGDKGHADPEPSSDNKGSNPTQSCKVSERIKTQERGKCKASIKPDWRRAEVCRQTCKDNHPEKGLMLFTFGCVRKGDCECQFCPASWLRENGGSSGGHNSRGSITRKSSSSSWSSVSSKSTSTSSQRRGETRFSGSRGTGGGSSSSVGGQRAERKLVWKGKSDADIDDDDENSCERYHQKRYMAYGACSSAGDNNEAGFNICEKECRQYRDKWETVKHRCFNGKDCFCAFCPFEWQQRRDGLGEKPERRWERIEHRECPKRDQKIVYKYGACKPSIMPGETERKEVCRKQCRGEQSELEMGLYGFSCFNGEDCQCRMCPRGSTSRQSGGIGNRSGSSSSNRGSTSSRGSGTSNFYTETKKGSDSGYKCANKDKAEKIIFADCGTPDSRFDSPADYCRYECDVLSLPKYKKYGWLSDWTCEKKAGDFQCKCQYCPANKLTSGSGSGSSSSTSNGRTVTRTWSSWSSGSSRGGGRGGRNREKPAGCSIERLTRGPCRGNVNTREDRCVAACDKEADKSNRKALSCFCDTDDYCNCTMCPR